MGRVITVHIQSRQLECKRNRTLPGQALSWQEGIEHQTTGSLLLYNVIVFVFLLGTNTQMSSTKHICPLEESWHTWLFCRRYKESTFRMVPITYTTHIRIYSTDFTHLTPFAERVGSLRSAAGARLCRGWPSGCGWFCIMSLPLPASHVSHSVWHVAT